MRVRLPSLIPLMVYKDKVFNKIPQSTNGGSYERTGQALSNGKKDNH